MKSQLINFTIDDGLLKKVDGLAKKEAKSRSEILREAARRLVQESQLRAEDFVQITKSARRINMAEDEAVELIDKVRTKLGINR